MEYRKRSRSTLTAVELDPGESLTFEFLDGRTRTITIVSTRSRLHSTNLEADSERPLQPDRLGRTVVRIHCILDIDGKQVELVRWVGNDRSFYEPWRLYGLEIWFDTADALFEILSETHGPCRPRKEVRLAVQEAGVGICPVLLHPWCPLPEGGLRIADCYDSTNCWLGPYFGAEAHGGLDINHPAGTPIWAPFSLDSHELYNRVDRGDGNNRWRGYHKWDDGSEWILQLSHVITVHYPETQAIPAGAQIADGAGVSVGSHEHSHFTFSIVEPDASREEAIQLDPWILFRQMYLDQRRTRAPRNPGY
jgi:hypothetical protein